MGICSPFNACHCDLDGVLNGQDTGRPGCASHLVDLDPFCHVSRECAQGASPSQAFPGTSWRPCDPLQCQYGGLASLQLLNVSFLSIEQQLPTTQVVMLTQEALQAVEAQRYSRLSCQVEIVNMNIITWLSASPTSAASFQQLFKEGLANSLNVNTSQILIASLSPSQIEQQDTLPSLVATLLVAFVVCSKNTSQLPYLIQQLQDVHLSLPGSRIVTFVQSIQLPPRNEVQVQTDIATLSIALEDAMGTVHTEAATSYGSTLRPANLSIGDTKIVASNSQCTCNPIIISFLASSTSILLLALANN